MIACRVRRWSSPEAASVDKWFCQHQVCDLSQGSHFTEICYKLLRPSPFEVSYWQTDYPQVAAWPTNQRVQHLSLLSWSAHQILSQTLQLLPSHAAWHRQAGLAGKRPILHSIAFSVLLDLIWHSHLFKKKKKSTNGLFSYFVSCLSVCCSLELTVKLNVRVPWNYTFPPHCQHPSLSGSPNC